MKSYADSFESAETYYVVKEQLKAHIAFKQISKFFVGPERDRTADPLLAKQVLSQLSYRPAIGFAATPSGTYLGQLVGPSGFEPLTPALSALCSNHLSYGPKQL